MSVIGQTLNTYFKRHPVPGGSTIGVAVSGGADSLCLAISLGEYARNHGLKLKAVTVDHDLRPESAAEAEFVAREMEKRGIGHTTLLWKGFKPQARLEEKAREKRYQLMSDWCRKNQIQFLFLAHHKGDQAETFWARLARGSGLDGLAAMVEQSRRDGITLCRPFLHLDKAVLENDLTNRHVLWVYDSMNGDENYERVRWRNRQSALTAIGLTPDRVDRTTGRLTRARQALDFYTDRFMQALTDIHPEGYATMTWQSLTAVSEEIAIRAIMRTLEVINPSLKNLSLDSVEKWWMATPRRATLGGCALVRQKGILFIAREPDRMERDTLVPPGILTCWDRFKVLSPIPVRISKGAADKELPVLVRQSVPVVSADQSVRVCFILKGQKKLENLISPDYKNSNKNVVSIIFEGVL